MKLIVLAIGDWNADASKTSSWFHIGMLPNSVRKTRTFGRVGYTYLITPSPMSVKPGGVHPGWITVSLLRTVIILLLALAPKLEERCSNRTQKID